jgi:hypothetical protein
VLVFLRVLVLVFVLVLVRVLVLLFVLVLVLLLLVVGWKPYAMTTGRSAIPRSGHVLLQHYQGISLVGALSCRRAAKARMRAGGRISRTLVLLRQRSEFAVQ